MFLSGSGNSFQVDTPAPSFCVRYQSISGDTVGSAVSKGAERCTVSFTQGLQLH